MQKMILRIFICLTLFFWQTDVHSQNLSDVQSGEAQDALRAAAQSNPEAFASLQQTTPANNPNGENALGVNNQDMTNQHRLAKSKEKKATGGAGSNALVSALMIGAGAACVAACSGAPPGCQAGCIPLFAMGAQAALQSGHDGNAAGGAFETGRFTFNNPDPTVTPPPPPPPPPGSEDPGSPDNGINTIPPNTPAGPFGTVGDIQKNMRNISAKMKELGMKVNPDGSVSMRDGTTISSGQIGAAAATGAGLNPGDHEKVKDILAKAGDAFEKYNVAAMDMDDGGGGGGGAGAFKFKPYESNFDMSKYLKGMNERKPASVAGLQRKVAGGESIGVAGDDIFQMIHRRYQSKRQLKYFIEK